MNNILPINNTFNITEEVTLEAMVLSPESECLLEIVNNMVVTDFQDWLENPTALVEILCDWDQMQNFVLGGEMRLTAYCSVKEGDICRNYIAKNSDRNGLEIQSIE
ncbi:hypothetical protein M0R04_01175 [Candidatus Dojkabacteria bacterium]|jgi:hypothetical protein|nr:hypothetical protein [Candidatus Dojkabacteria bacterium]